MRIFPEICASTLCPLSSSTRNMALGSVSSTVPVTSMASSFGIDNLPAAARRDLELTQNIGSVFRDRHRMLKMGGQAAVFGNRGPTVFLDFDFVTAGIDHRLDRQDHSFFQPKTAIRLAVIRHWRFFVQLLTDTVTDKRPHNGKPSAFGEPLHSRAQITQSLPLLEFLNASIEGLFGDVHQSLRFFAHFAYTYGERGIPVKTVIND